MPLFISIILIIALIFFIVAFTMLAVQAKKLFIENQAMHEEVVKIREESEKIAEEAKAKTEFLANTSREIRTPMNAISCAVELLLKEDLPNATYSYLNILRSSSDNLVSVVEDILDFSRLDSGKLMLNEEEYDVKRFYDDLCDLTTSKLLDKPIALVISINPTLPRTLIGDRGRVKQILFNLISNALKYTIGGKIEIRVDYERLSKDAIDLIFTVSDTGCGMPPSQKDALMERFRSNDPATKFYKEGSGLGLTIVKQLVTMMAGSVSFESELAKGSTFIARIRQKTGDDAPVIPEENIGRNFALDVLVWEDNPYYRESIIENLKALGIPSRAALTKGEAEGILSSVKMDYLITTGKHIGTAEQIVKKLSPATTLVRMYEVNETIEYGHAEYLRMLKPISIFNILDMTQQSGQREKAEAYGEGKFYASEAKLLLVDDNRVNLKIAKALIETFKVDVTAVDSGFEAMELYRTGNRYDIVFLDHMMPGMDGVETAKKIREFEGHSETPLIALTANAETEVQKMFLNEGLNDFIPKPIRLNNLTFILEKWLPKEKQKFEVEEEVSGRDRLNKEKEIFKPEKGLASVWNDEEIFKKTLIMFKENSPKLIKKIYSEKTGKIKKDEASELRSLAYAVGGTELAELLREFINIMDISDPSVLKAQFIHIKDAETKLVSKIDEYLSQNEGSDILTIEGL